MEAIFDNAAATYDSSFTNSHTGRMQRARVWKFLDQYVIKGDEKEVLEVNCGTGKDALHLANIGCNVVATDISKEMINTAESKQKKSTHSAKLNFVQLDILSTFKKYENQRFDLIFSNFGGLNCLNEDELKQAIHLSAKLLKEGGTFVAVVMPRFCIQESAYFLLKGDREKAKRRSSKNGAKAVIEGKEMTTHYYDSHFFKQFDAFQFKRALAVGFFLPPSYLEPFYQPKKVLMKSMYSLEKLIKPLHFLSNYSDHYFVQLQKV